MHSFINLTVCITVLFCLSSDALPTPKPFPPFLFLKNATESFWKQIIRAAQHLRLPRPSFPHLPLPPRDPLKESGCYVNLATLRVSLGLKIPWALKMTDATSRPAAGFLDQDFDALGVDDECLDVVVPENLGFQPEYAVVTLQPVMARIPSVMHPSKVTGLSMGLCLPDSCHEKDIKQIIRRVFQDKNITGYLDIQDVYIRKTNHYKLSGAAAGVISFLVIWVIIVGTCTTCDYMHTKSMTSRRRMRPRALPADLPTRKKANGQRAGEETGKGNSKNRERSKFGGNVKIKVTPHPDTNGPQTETEGPQAERSEPQTDGQSQSEDFSEIDELERGSVETEAAGPPKEKHSDIVGILRATAGIVSDRASPHPAETKLESLVKLVRCFSLYSSLPKLLDTSTSKIEIRCLHGIRVFSCVWVIMVNTLFYKALYMNNALRLMKDWKDNDFLYAFCGNGLLSLESMFTISGVLVGYSGTMRMYQKAGRHSWLAFLLHRYGRIVPTMVFVGFVYLCLFPHLTGGPLWTKDTPGQGACESWGWMNIFLVQNFAPSGSVCLPWTWFFAVDFQLFLLTPVFLVILYRSPKAAYVLAAVLVLAGWVAGGVVTQYHHLPVSQYTLPDLTGASGSKNLNSTATDDFGWMYMYQPYSHAGSFYPPLLLGYVLYLCKQRASFTRRAVLLGWAAAVSGMTLCLFVTRKALVSTDTPDYSAYALYNSLHRTLWSACVCWVILACSTGFGSVVNTLLSLSIWKPVSRLVFVAYLVHPMIVLGHSACLQQMVYLTSLVGAYLVSGVLVTSLAVSLVVTVLIEIPLTGLLHWITECCVGPVC